MKKLLVFFSFLLFVLPALAQNNETAELWEKYRQAKADTTKARLLDDLSFYYLYTDVDSAFILNNEAIKLAKKHHDKELQTAIRRSLSSFLLQIGAAQLALEIQFELLEEAKASGNGPLQHWMYNYITMNYATNLGDMENAKKYAYLAMQIPGWENNKDFCTSTFLNLGDVYTRLSQFDSARVYLNKAFDLSKSIFGKEENQFTSMIENNFGNLYLKINQPEMAMLYYRQALPYALSSKYADWIHLDRCREKEGESKTIPADLLSPDFKRNMQDVMFDEGILNRSAKPIWWDGQRIRFTKSPEAAVETKTSTIENK